MSNKLGRASTWRRQGKGSGITDIFFSDFDEVTDMKWLVWSDFGMKWLVWSGWYEVTSVWNGLVWSDWYEVSLCMKWLGMKWLVCSDNFSIWYEVTPKMKWLWYEVSGTRHEHFSVCTDRGPKPKNAKAEVTKKWAEQSLSKIFSKIVQRWSLSYSEKRFSDFR